MSKIFKGRITSDLVFNTLFAVTLGTGIAEYSLDIFFNQKYIKYFKEAFRNGSPIPMSESLRKRYDDVICDLKHTDFQKAFSTPFVAEGFEPVNVGCLNTRNGCFIGIPTIYDLNSIEDTTTTTGSVELQEYIRLMKEDPESGKKFTESLVLSEPAKKYSIAHALVLTDNFQILFKSISFPITLIPMYALGHTVISSLPVNQFKIRMLAFFLLCNLGIFVWLLARTVINSFYLSEADRKVCDIGLEYIHGGIEYYEKLIQRNLILRNIIPDGKKLYSEQGNKLAFFSVLSELPLTYRKKYLENRLKTYTNEDDATSTWQ